MPISTWPDKGSACLEAGINGGKLVKRNNQAAQSFFFKKRTCFGFGWLGSSLMLLRALPLPLTEKKESESEAAQLCPTLCDPMDSSLLGSFIHGIFQARILEWVAISFSRRSSSPRD